MHNRAADSSNLVFTSEQYRKSSEPNSFREAAESTREEMKKTSIFFRIWFGLKEKELLKLLIGSIAAGFSGISKPVFGYYIITIGVAYYHPDQKRHVGHFSLIFFLIGLFAIFTHTLQHYFFGVVGEKAMIHLRNKLYTGIKAFQMVKIFHMLYLYQNHHLPIANSMF